MIDAITDIPETLVIEVTNSHNIPDSKVHGASMGPIWGRQDPGGPHVGSMNFAIWDTVISFVKTDNNSLWHW